MMTGIDWGIPCLTTMHDDTGINELRSDVRCVELGWAKRLLV